MIQIIALRKGHHHPKGFPTGFVVNNSDDIFTHLGALLDRLKKADESNLENVYFALAHHSDLGLIKPSRTEQTFEYQTLLPFDIDADKLGNAVDQSRAQEYLPVIAGVLGVAPVSLVFLSSGNGLHVYAHLKNPIRSTKYFKEMRYAYNEVLFKMNRALKEAGLPGELDPAVWDAGRIMRLPNTLNIKTDKKTGGQLVRESILFQNPGHTPLDIDIFKLSGLDLIATRNVSPAQLKKNYPRPDFPHVMSSCEFLKECLAQPEKIHEPQFMHLLGLLGAMSPGDKFEVEGKDLSPKEVAGWVFDKAANSKSLQRGDFEYKWEHGTRYGAPKCKTIGATWLEGEKSGCEKCPFNLKIAIPLQLKGDEHISSQENGYWVMGKNAPLHPHYSDVCKIYRRDHSYVACEPDRIFTFDKTHYSSTGTLTVKSWLERNVGHEEHIRESHCVEFLKKVMRSGSISQEAEQDLFEKTIRGKLNCKNGILDILTGELLPHSGAVGFKYVLPYNFEPGEVSEFFLDWLAEVMQDRTELMDAVLDMMAYTLWPSYDDHVFAYFVGEGRNGKSTLLHVIQEILGRQNYSAVSLAQLGGNRFAPAQLEGKLANVSEESSGTDLSFEELNAIKDLSAGGEIQVENKGEKPFLLRNQAKLLFSANKTPRFHEQGRAIRSRLLVIPFDHTFENPDANVETRLLQEVPKITSMLVSRIQENVRWNKGKFKVSRGGVSAFEAQERVLLAGNSVVEWGKECLESTVQIPEEDYISCHEAYGRYSNWCQENNYKPANSHQFGYIMTHGVLSPAIEGSKTKRVANKIVRVYPHTRWKEER